MITINPFYDYSKVETEEEFVEQLQSIKELFDAGISWELFQHFILKLKYEESVFKNAANEITLETLEEHYNFELPKWEFTTTQVSLFLNHILKYSKLFGNLGGFNFVRNKPKVEEFSLVYLVYKMMEIEK